MNRYLPICLLSFAVLLLCPAELQAQAQAEAQYSFDFRGVPLSDVLERIATESGVDMVYDPELVRGITVYQRVHNLAVPEVLKLVLAGTSLDFLTLSSGTIVIVLTVTDEPSYGSYVGKVVDRVTGEPLAGATVMLADASGGTSTSATGTFALNHLISGSYQIVFSYIGYEPVYKTIDIKPNLNTRQEIALTPKPVDVVPIVVTGHIPRMPHPDSDGQIAEPISPWETTGRMQDAIRTLNLFTGVQYGLPMTDLHLQGSQSGEHRIMLDGVPVYNPQSFGQMFSAFSPYSINKIRLYKAGFGVSEGSQIAGIVDLSHDIHGFQQDRFMLQGNPLSVNLRGDVIVSDEEGSPLKIMTAVRSNYWDLYRDPRLNSTLREWDDLDPLITNFLLNAENNASLYEPREHNSDVQFYDVHLAAHYQLDVYKSLYTSFYLGKNFVSTDLLRQAPAGADLPGYLYARDQYNWHNFVGQVTYNNMVSSRLDINSQISFSSNRFRNQYALGTSYTLPSFNGNLLGAEAAFLDFVAANSAGKIPTQRNDNSIHHLTAKSDGTYSFTPRFQLEAGLQMDFVESRMALSDLFYLPTESDQRSLFFSGYLNGNWTLGSYWKLTLGNRLTLTTPSLRVFPEPRLSVQYDRPDSDIGYWSVRLSGGLYRQFVNQFDITNPGPTSLVPSMTVWSHEDAAQTPQAWHLSNSFYLEPSENTTLNLEWFYKWQPTSYIVSYSNLLQGGSMIDRSGLDAFARTTEMQTLGVGLRLHQSLAESQLKLMLGYDYSYNRINLEEQFGRSLPAPWNVPHRFQLRAMWDVLPGLTAVAKWQSMLGRAWGFRQAYYNYLFYLDDTSFGRFNFTSPQNDRLSPFHQFDISIISQSDLPFMDMEIRLDLINILNRRNTIDWGLQPTLPGGSNDQYRIKERTLPGFNPSLSIQLRF